jgi:hypothetical protein
MEGNEARDERLRDEKLLQGLKEHPQLYGRIEDLLAIVSNADGDTWTADEAEEQVVAEVRRIGHEALQAWANRKLQRVESEYGQRTGYERRGKKNSIGRPALGH